MDQPIIIPECVQTLCDKRFIRLYDLQYAPGKHYYDASRRTAENLVCLKSDEEAKAMLPDAVSCVVILEVPHEEPKLLLSWEYRYPAGRYLLSVPAGLIDPEDQGKEDPLALAAAREIHEETGLSVQPGDTVRAITPFLYSTPGMTDESNALMEVILHPADLSGLNQSGAVGSECFDGFALLTQKEASALLQSGRDQHGHFFSIFTWSALIWFVSNQWKR